MISLRTTVNTITKASIASRIVAGIPKAVASPSMQRAFFSELASYKQQVGSGESTSKRASDVAGNIKISKTLEKFKLDGKVAVVTG
jgi:hypothetical protein